MKKIIIIFICLLLVVGCGKAKPNSTGSNTSTGTNTQSSSTGSNPQISSTELEKNIVTSGAVSKRGKLIVFATNNNKVAVDMDFEVEFYDASGTIVGSASEDLNGVGPGAEVAVEMYSTPDNWDNYKIYVDVENTYYKTYFGKLNITHSNNKKEIAVQVTNNSEDIIEYISVAVVYYQGETPVGIEDGFQDDIKPGRSANFNISYDYDKKYNDVRFDSYKVFVTEAYSYEE